MVRTRDDPARRGLRYKVSRRRTTQVNAQHNLGQPRPAGSHHILRTYIGVGPRKMDAHARLRHVVKPRTGSGRPDGGGWHSGQERADRQGTPYNRVLVQRRFISPCRGWGAGAGRGMGSSRFSRRLGLDKLFDIAYARGSGLLGCAENTARLAGLRHGWGGSGPDPGHACHAAKINRAVAPTS